MPQILSVSLDKAAEGEMQKVVPLTDMWFLRPHV